MIVQAGPAFLQFPWQGEYLLPKFLFCMSRGIIECHKWIQRNCLACNLCNNSRKSRKGAGMETKRQRIPLKTVTDRGMKTEGRTCPVLKQIAFIMRLYDNCVPWSCVYIKLSVGTLVLPFRSIPHTQQHIIHKAPRLYITKIYINSTWSVQCIIQLLFRNWGFPELG